MTGDIYNYKKRLPKKLHCWFIAYHVEENFDSRKDAQARMRELYKQHGITAALFTRERALSNDQLRGTK